MTLNTRNKLLLFFSVFSSLCSLFFVIALIRILIQGPQKADFLFDIPSVRSFWFIPIISNYPAVFLSRFLLSLFIPAVGFAIYFNFEKTQSLEVLFFSAFLIGFLGETFTLCIPLFGLTAGYSTILRFIGQAAFFGEMEVLLAIIIQAVIASGSENRDSDKYLGLIIVSALIFSTIIPLNTSVLKDYMRIHFGSKDLLATIRIIFSICAFLALLLSSKSKESADYKKASFNFLFICCGYILLLECLSFAFLISGAALLIAGTVRFLKNMHRYYMWK
ncbi:hypothetical protein V1L52_03440 [Treponema sp. HNW]|uniref:hypothetical protein n=1 Tax=Treponema sp. HNW TaxID=3116654 RepID=UPI003D126634